MPLLEAVMFCLRLLTDALICKAVFSRSCLFFCKQEDIKLIRVNHQFVVHIHLCTFFFGAMYYSTRAVCFSVRSSLPTNGE